MGKREYGQADLPDGLISVRKASPNPELSEVSYSIASPNAIAAIFKKLICSVKVKNWVKENETRIRLFFLPGSSPEFNPDELLNQDVKSNALGRQRPGNQTELMGKVRITSGVVNANRSLLPIISMENMSDTQHNILIH